MRFSFLISIGFHVSLALVAWLSTVLNWWQPDLLDAPPPSFEVELVAELDEDIPAEAEPPKPEPKKTPPPPPKPAPKPEPKPQPKPAPAPEPEPEPEAEVIPEKEKPKPEKKKVEKPKPKPKAAPEKETAKVKLPRPKSKPKEPKRNDFSSVLKTVAKIKDKPKPQPKKVEEKPKKKEDAFAKLTQGLKRKPKPQQKQQQSAFTAAGSKLSSREMDAVRQQIAGCWNVPSGAVDAENLVVRISVVMNPDMTVRRAEIDNSSNNGNPFWLQASESALRAVHKCSPLRLPPGKYDVWNIINFTFNPKEMFG